MLIDTNWLGVLSNLFSAIEFCDYAAANLAAFPGAFGAFVAALCSISKTVSARCAMRIRIGILRLQIKEHDAQIFPGSNPIVAVGFYRCHCRANTTEGA